MKTRTKRTAIAVFAFGMMVTALLPSNTTLARVDESPKVGSILIENGSTFNRTKFLGNLKPEVNSATPAIGSYELYFHAWRNGVLEPVTSLPVLSHYLILRAYIYDGFGVPAQSGTAVFEYCSYKGRPPNDIERADEAPKEACDAGIASWRRLQSVDLSIPNCPGFGIGNACMNFGIVRIPRDVGFRFRFSGKRSGIDSGMSEAANFTWTASL